MAVEGSTPSVKGGEGGGGGVKKIFRPSGLSLVQK